MPRDLTDDIPSIAIGALMAGGSLAASLDGSIELTRLDTEKVLLSHLPEGSRTSQTVGLARVKLKFGDRLHFVCPVSGRRCSRLYFKDGLFASREAHGLAYQSQRQDRDERLAARARKIARRIEGDDVGGPARGRNRASLLRRLEAATNDLVGVGETPSELVALVDREHELGIARRRRVRPRPGDSPMLMRSALQAGRTHAIPITSTAIQSILTRRLADQAQQPSPDLDLPPMGIDARPQLDIRRLKPIQGYARGHRMIWPSDGRRDGLQVLGRLTKLGLDSWRLDLWIDDLAGEICHGQQVPIIITAGRREMLMVCPVMGTRHRKLYYRAGRFASAAAQCLTRR
jgi:hypothetical protein